MSQLLLISSCSLLELLFEGDHYSLAAFKELSMNMQDL